MVQMPDGSCLASEMLKALPLYCYSNKRNTQTLAAQGLRLSEKTRLEVIDVRDLFEAGGIMCVIKYLGQPLVMSITGLDFTGNGDIDEKISKYKTDRIEWLKQEERRDIEQGIGERIKVIRQADGVSRNGPCPCGSGKKYKRCCGKEG